MRRIVLLWFVASSIVGGWMAHAATHPSYGGTLRISIQAAPSSLDPSDPVMADTHAGQQISRALFDTLLTLDEHGLPEPCLATRWESDPGQQRWRISLRSGVRFDDDSPVTAATVASSLRSSNPQWRVSVEGDQVVIESNSPAPDLPSQLTLARNAIAKRDGKLQGTGPFIIGDWDPGKRLTLIAREDYWGGRAFLNSAVITLGQSYRDQMVALELNKADAIEIPPDQTAQAVADGTRVESSRPMELIALVFAQDPRSADEARFRQLLARSLDRTSMNAVLLQNSGEAAAGLLPNWMTGYEFLFEPSPSEGSTNQVRGRSVPAAHWSFAYEGGDPALRVIAERVILNARDVGITLDIARSSQADLRLVRVPIESLGSDTALLRLAQRFGAPRPLFRGDLPADAYAVESAMITSGRVIPLIHSRFFYGLSKETRDWDKFKDGDWHLENVWREATVP
jgi:ABC-type transport system substrate-binding protein